MDGSLIRYIQNPSEKEQLTAIRSAPEVIKYIKNPTEQVLLFVVSKNPFTIQYIQNPNEKIQLTAVNIFGWAIQHIKNPSEAVQLAAIKQDASSIFFIQNPSDQALWEAYVAAPGTINDYLNDKNKERLLQLLKNTLSKPKTANKYYSILKLARNYLNL
jgi:hypothetical protein